MPLTVRWSCTTLALLGCSLTAGPLPAAPAALDAQAAMQIVNGCATHAKGRGQSHAIAVVDAGGFPLALLRMDGNPPGVAEFAIQKAEAVAHWQFSTRDMLKAASDTPGFAAAPHVVIVPGGVPVYSADSHQFVGAVGVSGEAPADDAACAEAGIKAAGFTWSRRPG